MTFSLLLNFLFILSISHPFCNWGLSFSFLCICANPYSLPPLSKTRKISITCVGLCSFSTKSPTLPPFARCHWCLITAYSLPSFYPEGRRLFILPALVIIFRILLFYSVLECLSKSCPHLSLFFLSQVYLNL